MRGTIIFILSLYLTGCNAEDSDDTATVYGQDSDSFELGWRPVRIP